MGGVRANHNEMKKFVSLRRDGVLLKVEKWDESDEVMEVYEPPPSMEPYSVLSTHLQESSRSSIDYWHAQSLASSLHQEFQMRMETGDVAGMRNRFYALIEYYNLSLDHLRVALKNGKTPSILTSLRCLIALNTPLRDMHRIAPTAIPLILTISKKMRNQLINDILINGLQESVEPRTIKQLTSYVNRHQFLDEIRSNTISRRIQDLIAKGHVKELDNGYSRTKRAYISTNLDDASLHAFLGQDLYEEFERGGFPGISNILTKKSAFQKFFEKKTNSGPFIADMFVAAIAELLGTESLGSSVGTWHHRDLINSIVPRPYQRDAFTIFRGYGYQGQLIEAPTGSGKTMIGMMAIQDWLGSMSSGESILVLVPTVNYEQQWIREVCYKTIGLQLSPDESFAGTPTAFETERKKTGFHPPVLIMTYTALAQLGSPKGKGGFDQISVEKFLQGSNVRYVILDEVHKVVEKLESVSASVTRLLIEWLKDGSLEGLIGFSGTATAYRPRFEELGLKLVYIMPSADLIAYGFVAPFGEFGVPFTYSDREQQIIDSMDQYKSLLEEYIELMGFENLRREFSSIPLRERKTIGRDFLGMYAYRKDRNEALGKRFREWSSGEDIKITEYPLITIIQLARGIPDHILVEKMIQNFHFDDQTKRKKRFEKVLRKIRRIRRTLRKLVFYPDISSRLNMKHFGVILDSQSLRDFRKTKPAKVALREKTKDIIATSIIGLYTSLKSLYYRMGEGRLESVTSVIKAEHVARKLSGVIVFGRGKRINWEEGITTPGYAGVAGIFAHMLGEKNLTPMAVLSDEMYLPWSDKNSIPHQISDFIRHEIMISELGTTLFTLITQGIEMDEEKRGKLRYHFDALLIEYVRGLGLVGAPRPKEFVRDVLDRLREAVISFGLEDVFEKLNSRMDLKNRHMQTWISNFYNYAIISSKFLKAPTESLFQANGVLQKFHVVKMSQGDRKQLMYDLTARIVDADNLPINIIIVSSWARTGWNVIKPNLLIDATATRNVTAWQQLRGRAMRAMKSWDKECYEAMMILLGSKLKEIEDNAKIPPLDLEREQDVLGVNKKLDVTVKDLLLEIHDEYRKLNGEEEIENKDKLTRKIKRGDLVKFKEQEREQLATELMMIRNKVTHIYELVKAYGSTIQIRYDRRKQKWRRTQEIAAKHAHGFSVNPITGEYAKGEIHAPLLYSGDPREYSPTKLKKHVAEELKGRDNQIVDGWMKAVISG
jgi:superfamily II DNA or RNA helicase